MTEQARRNIRIVVLGDGLVSAAGDPKGMGPLIYFFPSGLDRTAARKLIIWFCMHTHYTRARAH
jgi:hypothetical protein